MHVKKSAGLNIVFCLYICRGKKKGDRDKKIEQFAERQNLGTDQAVSDSASRQSTAVLITFYRTLCPAVWKYRFTHRLSKLILWNIKCGTPGYRFKICFAD